MPLGTEVNLSPGDVVSDGVPDFPFKRGTAPQFLAHVYCGQMAGWMKTPLGTEIKSRFYHPVSACHSVE